MFKSYRVSDINPGRLSSNPLRLTAVGDNLLFRAWNPGTGFEIWKSDGTTVGTVLVQDIHPTPYGFNNPAEFFVVGDVLYFSATDGSSGRELWKTDGTAAGTVRVADIIPGQDGSWPSHLTSVGSTLFFFADDGTSGRELWKSDGTAAGTVLVADINPGLSGSSPKNLTTVGSTVFFSADDGNSGEELWKSDGTAEGTIRVRDINPGSQGSNPGLPPVSFLSVSGFTAVGNTLFFSADDGSSGRELWKSDGTAAGTVRVADIYSGSQGSNPSYLTAVGDTLFFTAMGDAGDSDYGDGTELWKSDGTAAGTRLVKDIRPGDTFQYGTVDFGFGGGPHSESRQVDLKGPHSLTAVGNTLYFSADDGEHGRELWKSDGTWSGTVRVTDINPGQGDSNPGEIDLSRGADVVVAVGDTLFFTADDHRFERQLWSTDGTADGTVQVSPGLFFNPKRLTVVGDTLFFQAKDLSGSGIELWALDLKPALAPPSLALTPRAADRPEGDSGLKKFTFTVTRTGDLSVESTAAWSVQGFGDHQVNVSDFVNHRLPSGTIRFRPGQSTKSIAVFVNGDTIIESDEQFSVVLSDPTRATITRPSAVGTIRSDDRFGTTSDATVPGLNSPELPATPIRLANINGGAYSSAPINLTAVGDTLYFTADDGSRGRELWKSDGTAAGTVLVSDIRPGGSSGSYPNDLTAVGDTLYFTADDGNGRDLWRTKGSELINIKDIIQENPMGFTSDFIEFDDNLFFRARLDGTVKKEIWRTDGTSTGTVHVADSKIFSFPSSDIYSGSAAHHSIPPLNSDFGGVDFTVVGETLYFVDEDDNGSEKLFKISESNNGIVELASWKSDHNIFIKPQYLTAVGDTLFFNGWDENLRFQLWKSRGTQESTVRVDVINPGIFFNPKSLTAVGDTLYFTADDGSRGRELWKSDGTAAGTVLVSDIRPVGSSSSYPNDLTAVGDTLYFTADDGSTGRELWKTDGTAAGTVRLADINPGLSDSVFLELTAVGDILYFTADDGSSGRELWRSDGTVDGTVLVADINPEGSSNPLDLTVVGDTLFFSATTSAGDRELWALKPGANLSLPSLALTSRSADKFEGDRGSKKFTFTVTRTGDLSLESSADWAVVSSGNHTADASDFFKNVIPSGTVRFRAGESTRTIKVRVKGDRNHEFDETFSVTLTNPNGATITQATASGLIRNNDLIGTAVSDTITGSGKAEFINGLAGQDVLTGRGAPDRFGFRFGESEISSPDRITDFRFGQDSISLLNKRDQFLPVPQEFSRAADNSTASTLRDLADAVFADADGFTEGNHALAANAAALVQSTNASIAGTYLLINNGNAGRSLTGDLLIDITGFSGPLPDLGFQPVGSVFI